MTNDVFSPFCFRIREEERMEKYDFVMNLRSQIQWGLLLSPSTPLETTPSSGHHFKDSLWTLIPTGGVWTGRPRGSGQCGQDVGGTETTGVPLVYGGRTMERYSGSDTQGLRATGARPPPPSLFAQTQGERQRGPGASPLQTRLGLEPVLCHWGVHRPRSRLSRSGK